MSCSSTFAGKTAFAQEKYLKKKAKKHMPFVSVQRPSPLTLCDLYTLKGPEKLLGLRRQLSLGPAQVAHRAVQARPEAATLESVPPPAGKGGVSHPRCEQSDQVGQTLRRRAPKGKCIAH